MVCAPRELRKSVSNYGCVGEWVCIMDRDVATKPLPWGWLYPRCLHHQRRHVHVREHLHEIASNDNTIWLWAHPPPQCMTVLTFYFSRVLTKFLVLLHNSWGEGEGVWNRRKESQVKPLTVSNCFLFLLLFLALFNHQRKRWSVILIGSFCETLYIILF